MKPYNGKNNHYLRNFKQPISLERKQNGVKHERKRAKINGLLFKSVNELLEEEFDGLGKIIIDGISVIHEKQVNGRTEETVLENYYFCKKCGIIKGKPIINSYEKSCIICDLVIYKG